MFLLETLDLTDVVPELYSKQVVSSVERDDILAGKTSFRANEKFLSVLSRRSPQQFQLFLDALDNCGQQHVRDVIADRRPESAPMGAPNAGGVGQNRRLSTNNRL